MDTPENPLLFFLLKKAGIPWAWPQLSGNLEPHLAFTRRGFLPSLPPLKLLSLGGFSSQGVKASLDLKFLLPARRGGKGRGRAVSRSANSFRTCVLGQPPVWLTLPRVPQMLATVPSWGWWGIPHVGVQESRQALRILRCLQSCSYSGRVVV